MYAGLLSARSRLDVECSRCLYWPPDGICVDRCLAMDATDARAHVALGKLLVQQRRYDEARALYEEGSTATGGSPSMITPEASEVAQRPAAGARSVLSA